MKLEPVSRHAPRAAGPRRLDARFPPASDPFLSRIDALPVNSAARASARANYLAAERSVNGLVALQERLRALVAAWHCVFGTRERSRQ